MQNRVEPPVLISRLMTFVLATAVVVVGALGVTLSKMFPLNRPQIFFLSSPIRDGQDIKLVEMPPKDENLDIYKKAFVYEYIKNRNEIVADANEMHKKWDSRGPVRTMSTDEVYAGFINTKIFNDIMTSIPKIDAQCAIFFDGAPMYLASDTKDTETYQVKFRYLCKDYTGPEIQKDYTIKIKLSESDDRKIKWVDRIENPLGLKVIEYTIVSGDGDPLDTNFAPIMQNINPVTFEQTEGLI